MAFRVSATSNADDLERRLNNVFARQIPFATALGLTRTAQKIREAERAEAQRVFDRPTPFTLNAFRVVPATKETQVAEVRYRDPAIWARRHYLETQTHGGTRGMTGLERRLRFDLREVGAFEAIIPTSLAAKDAYGNWSAGERNRVLSALNAQLDPLSNSTDRSKRRGGKWKRFEYKLGRVGAANNVAILRTRNGFADPIALFVRKRPQYRPRFEFYEVGARTFNAVYPAEFEAAMTRALATAR